MNKSLVTNFVSILIVIYGYFSPVYKDIIMMTGLFALSGGITNWLAIHMLFERVPLLYGSGVVPNRFEEFKIGIKNLIIKEFFNKEHIERFFSENNSTVSIDAISSKIDFNKIYDGLADAIEESPMGGMLAMMGGKDALEPIKEPVILKLKSMVAELSSSEASGAAGSDFIQNLTDKVENIVDNRLNELTPEMVKKIVQDMIHKHLGWLVVWGGVFGGLIGLIVSVV